MSSDEVPVRLLQFQERHAREHARIVDQHVDWAERGDRVADQTAALLRPRHIALHQGGVRGADALGSHPLGRLAVVEIVDRHRRPLTREGDRERSPEALLRAGDENRLARKAPHHTPPSLVAAASKQDRG